MLSLSKKRKVLKQSMKTETAYSKWRKKPGNAAIERLRSRSYYAANRQRAIARAMEYQKTHTRNRRFVPTQKQKQKAALRISILRRDHPESRMMQFIVRRLRIESVRRGFVKCGAARELLGCSWSEFVSHMESKFRPGMSWKNHTVNGWHIDHITPCSKFDLSKPDQQRACFHYSNHQPLWYAENIRKSNRTP